MSDFFAIVVWWGTLGILGVIAYPFTSMIFSRFVDRGYIFAKVVGILIVSYVVWLSGSLHLLPFTRPTVIIVMLAWTLLSLWFGRNKREDKPTIPWRWILIEEVLFFVALWAWSYVRATEPSIHGLEKFMDFGFVNSILRSTYFPPLDMWLTKSPEYEGGHFINYYYFGHYYFALLTKLSGIDSAITYNLSLATLFAFTFTLPFSLGANLLYLFKRGENSNLETRSTKQIPNTKTKNSNFGIRISSLQLIACGLLAAFVVSLGGNLHTYYVFTAGYPNHESPIPPWKLALGFFPDRYWYPDATRFIANTIHEFPLYSFVVADLHGHVADIPFVMLALAILLAILHTGFHRDNPGHVGNLGEKLDRKGSFLREFYTHSGVPLPHLVLLSILLACMYMTNAWDGMIYMILAVIVFCVHTLRLSPTISFREAVAKVFAASLFLFFGFLLASFPFMLNFKPFVSGVGVLCAPKALADTKIGPLLFEANHCQKSPLYMLATLWGFFYYSVAGFFLFILIPTVRGYFSHAAQQPKKPAFWARIVGLAHTLTPSDWLILSFVLVSTLLITFPEFFYLKDIYPAHYRANTMFKLGYQAFMMLGIVVAYTVFRLKSVPGRGILRLLYSIIFVALFTLIAIYPYFAISSYYDKLRTYRGLDGLTWMETQYPDDYKAILWIRNSIPGQPVIAEANGESYTDYARVSSYTGLPTIVGWPVHEWLWRGSYDEAGKRIPEVEAIYQSTDAAHIRSILKKYAVEYIFVGNLEREKYPTLDEARMKSFGDIVFESGETRIYKVRPQ